MLTTAFDASGAEHDQAWVVCAGFVATAKGWDDFSKRWKERLGPIPAFQASSYRNRLGDATYERDPLVRDLVRLIHEFAWGRFAGIVRVADLPAMSDEVRHKFHLGAYNLAGLQCVALVRRWAFFRSIGWDQLEFVFEKGDLDWERLRQALEEDRMVPTHPDFRRKKDVRSKNGQIVEQAFLPLQAADLYAHEAFRALKQPGRSFPILTELEIIPGYTENWTVKDLHDLELGLRRFRMTAGGT